MFTKFIRLRQFIFLLVVFNLVACSGGKGKKVVDLKDVMDYDSDQHETKTIVENDSTLYWKLFFEKGGIKTDSVKVNRISGFPDRFNPENSMKFILYKGVDSIEFNSWKYKDSLKVMNAFYNWIDCFGPKCKSVYVGSELNFQAQKMNIYVNDTSLIYISGNSLNTKDWFLFLNELGYKSDFNYLIEQNKNGRAKWFVFEDEVKTLYKK